MDNLTAFEEANPGFREWWSETTFDFAISLRTQVARKGYLSPAQLAAATKCMVKAAQRDRNARTEVDAGELERVFAIARSKGFKRVGVKVGPFRFSPAPEQGANPGAVYTKKDGEYLGKMLNGRFFGNASDQDLADIVRIAADPLGSAIAHGKMTGECAVCSRTLSDPVSIERGIGPVCADKFGW